MEVTRVGWTLILAGSFDGRSSAIVRDNLYVIIDESFATAAAVDLSRVECLDSTALKLLGAASHHLERNGRHLLLRGCTPSIRRVLTFSRLRRLFQVERERTPEAAAV